MTVRLHVAAALVRDAEIELPAPAARHVQVRRLQPGDEVVLFNGEGGEWRSRVLRMTRTQVWVRTESFDAVERELHVGVSLALGMPANDRMDVLVEKASELGAQSIQPLICARSVLRLAGERAVRKRAHWQAIAAAAAEQCGRTRLTAVAPVLQFEHWLSALDSAAALRVLLSPRDGAPPLHTVASGARSLLTLSGPEGGLTLEEEAAAAAKGFIAVRLGERVLRAETAPLAVLGWIGLQP